MVAIANCDMAEWTPVTCTFSVPMLIGDYSEERLREGLQAQINDCFDAKQNLIEMTFSIAKKQVEFCFYPRHGVNSDMFLNMIKKTHYSISMMYCFDATLIPQAPSPSYTPMASHVFSS